MVVLRQVHFIPWHWPFRKKNTHKKLKCLARTGPKKNVMIAVIMFTIWRRLTFNIDAIAEQPLLFGRLWPLFSKSKNLLFTHSIYHRHGFASLRSYSFLKFMCPCKWWFVDLLAAIFHIFCLDFKFALFNHREKLFVHFFTQILPTAWISCVLKYFTGIKTLELMLSVMSMMRWRKRVNFDKSHHSQAKRHGIALVVEISCGVMVIWEKMTQNR